METQRIRLLLTKKQMNILTGDAVINTIESLLDGNEDFNYDKEAIKQLIKKLKENN
jgi:predicted DNA-binding protein YlxM (UPF0122 family)